MHIDPVEAKMHQSRCESVHILCVVTLGLPCLLLQPTMHTMEVYYRSDQDSSLPNQGVTFYSKVSPSSKYLES